MKDGNGDMSKRGYSLDDEHTFKGPALEKLKCAAFDLYYLLNRGYQIKGASTFVGNHYLLTERQRIALTRTVSPESSLTTRQEKKIAPERLKGETVNIDGFNQIITLEVALSQSPVFWCMDGTFRDLAGLRGTYKLIDKTSDAIRLIISELKKLSVKHAVFWLDAPVSNSGRLKALIAEIAEDEQFDICIEIVNNVDKVLYELLNVISSDSIVLDLCLSWFNLNERILPAIPNAWLVDLN